MRDLLRILLENSVGASALALVLLALSPCLRRVCSPRSLRAAWLVVLVCFALPFRLLLPTTVTVSLPSPSLPAAPPSVQAQALPASARLAPSNPIASGSAPRDINGAWGQTSGVSFRPEAALLLLWAAGALGWLTLAAARHVRFARMVRRWGAPADDEKLLAQMETLRRWMGVRANVSLWICPTLDTPLLYGLFRPRICLQDGALPQETLELVLRHELTHLRHGDLWVRALSLAAVCLNWFNPMVYLAARSGAHCCETACDAAVLQNASFAARKAYGQTLLALARRGKAARTPLTTYLYGGKKQMRLRLASLLDMSRKRTGVLLVVCAMLAAVVGVAFEQPAQESSAHAQTAALPTDEPLAGMDGETSRNESQPAGELSLQRGDIAYLNNPQPTCGFTEVCSLADFSVVGAYANGTQMAIEEIYEVWGDAYGIRLTSIGEPWASVRIGGGESGEGVAARLPLRLLSASPPQSRFWTAQPQTDRLFASASDDAAVLPRDDVRQHVCEVIGFASNGWLHVRMEDDYGFLPPGSYTLQYPQEDAYNAWIWELTLQRGDFAFWPLIDKAASSDMARSSGVAQSVVYTLPDGNAISETKAVALAREALCQAYARSDGAFDSYVPAVYYYYHADDPEQTAYWLVELYDASAQRREFQIVLTSQGQPVADDALGIPEPAQYAQVISAQEAIAIAREALSARYGLTEEAAAALIPAPKEREELEGRVVWQIDFSSSTNPLEFYTAYLLASTGEVLVLESAEDANG